MKLPYADDLNYWKTSKRSADDWMDLTVNLIINLGGKVLSWGSGSDPQSGLFAYVITFQIGDDKFHLIWPVLPTRNKADARAARVQAATMMYHDTKAKCLKAVVFGARTAFLEYLQLPDGRSMAMMTTPELIDRVPRMLRPADVQLQLPPKMKDEDEP